MIQFRATRSSRLAAAIAAALVLPIAAAAQGAAPAPAAPAEVPEASPAGSAQAEDPFAPGAFEAAAGTAPGSAPAPKTEYLVGGSALVSAIGYAPAAMDGYAASAAASGKLFGKVSVPDYGSLFVSYALRQPFLSALAGGGPPYAAPPADLERAAYAMPELHYSFDVGKRVFARLGKQLLAWGPSRVWSPVDFVNSSRADFFAPVDLREGKSGLRLHAPLGKANAFLFADFSAVSSEAGARDLAGATVLDGRLDAPMGGFELGLTGRAGREVQGMAGFDFSGDLLGWAAYGELALGPAYSGYESLAQASLGLSRALGDLKRWTISAEGFFNSAGADRSGDFAAMAADPLYVGAWYAYAALAAKELISRNADATLSGLANFSDGSYTLKLAWDLSPPGAPPFSVALAYYGGGEEKELTCVAGDRALSLSLQTRIDF